MSETSRDLVLDVDAEHARALHGVVRAMHDGHCPKCGFLGPATDFERCKLLDEFKRVVEIDHGCPQCGFLVTAKESKAALKAFQPHLNKSVAIFEKWRNHED